ncbi:hypothetical protein, partial [Escherichia coli]|uniref:hypothetical protein n=1 Tax=Escherichia coli TaxID=562 RepID=UPI00215A4E92
LRRVGLLGSVGIRLGSGSLRSAGPTRLRWGRLGSGSRISSSVDRGSAGGLRVQFTVHRQALAQVQGAR